jgi:hypothetical protein
MSVLYAERGTGMGTKIVVGVCVVWGVLFWTAVIAGWMGRPGWPGGVSSLAHWNKMCQRGYDPAYWCHPEVYRNKTADDLYAIAKQCRSVFFAGDDKTFEESSCKYVDYSVLGDPQ